jgi:hypothetical protein
MITRAQINKVLEEPVVKHISQPEGSYTDEEFIVHIKQLKEVCTHSSTSLAKEVNLDPRLISKAVNGYIQPQVASALGYKAMRHFNGTDAYRIWVKIN